MGNACFMMRIYKNCRVRLFALDSFFDLLYNIVVI